MIKIKSLDLKLVGLYKVSTRYMVLISLKPLVLFVVNESWYMILIIGLNIGLKFHQFDVKLAFIKANIDIPIYCELPHGMYTDNKYKNKVAKINKALYGLK